MERITINKAEEIRRLFSEKVSRSEIASRIGCSISYVDRIVYSKSQPKVRIDTMLKPIMKAMGPIDPEPRINNMPTGLTMEERYFIVFFLEKRLPHGRNEGVRKDLIKRLKEWMLP